MKGLCVSLTACWQDNVSLQIMQSSCLQSFWTSASTHVVCEPSQTLSSLLYIFTYLGAYVDVVLFLGCDVYAGRTSQQASLGLSDLTPAENVH